MKVDRAAVHAKYGGRCAYCGREIAIEDMQIDHLIPQIAFAKGKADGNPDDINNLMPSCRICNHYKRANSLEYFREAIETIPQKLGKRQYIFKVGIAYGFWSDKRRGPLKFYFEVKDEWEMIKSQRTEQEGG